MRLLQLALSHDEMLDLHPLVSVVSELDEEGRRRLVDVIVGLANATAVGPKGLLEAHGVLFDLSTDMLELLDIRGGEAQPVVTADELPARLVDPRQRERSDAERALAEVDGRRASARETQLQAQAVVTSARDAVERAQERQASLATRSASIAGLEAALADAVERRSRLEGQHAEVSARAAAAVAHRAEVEASTAALRDAPLEATRRRADLAERLDGLRAALDPGAEESADEAARTLAQVEAEVETEIEAEVEAEHQVEHQGEGDAGIPNEPAAPDEPPAERVERIVQRIDHLEKGLTAFQPAETGAVAGALAAFRPTDQTELVPSPEALRLAGALESVEAEVHELGTAAGAPTEVAEARRRLDDARRTLEEAELAVRNPELDRDLVQDLEHAHADLLDAIDKADSRFGGARAQRKVEAMRSVELELLDQLGFTSYSDYMMGYSLLNVDPDKEETLDRARSELSGAEDVWRLLEVETEAELAHAEVMDRRRGLLDEARKLLGQPVPPAEVVHELRTLRVEPTQAAPSSDALRQSLDDAGLALGDDELEHEDLVMVAEAWLAEAGAAPERERAMRDELSALAVELDTARAALDDGEPEPPPPPTMMGPSAEELRVARLNDARHQATRTADRLARHREADAGLSDLSAELVRAEQAERLAAEAAAEPEAATAEASRLEAAAQAEERRLSAEVAEAQSADAQARENLRAGVGGDGGLSPDEEVAAALVAAGAALSSANERAAEAANAVGSVEVERRPVLAQLEALGPAEDAVPEGSVAEEIEWYVLARLAAQRSVSLGGSLPLLIDDALSGLGEHELTHVLGRLERMAQAVQIIVLSDDVTVRAWAHDAGVTRAAVVHRQSA